MHLILHDRFGIVHVPSGRRVYHHYYYYYHYYHYCSCCYCCRCYYSLCISFCRTYSALCIYHLAEGSIIIIIIVVVVVVVVVDYFSVLLSFFYNSLLNIYSSFWVGEVFSVPSKLSSSTSPLTLIILSHGGEH